MGRIARVMSLGLCGVMAVAGYASALDDAAETIKIVVGEFQTITVKNPQRLAIAKPEIADVTAANKNELTVTGKKAGVTTLVVWDVYGEQSYVIKVIPEDVAAIKARVDALLKQITVPDVRTQAEEDAGKVILLGNVKDKETKDRISQLLGDLKEKTIDLTEIRAEEAGVEIEVQVLELDRDSTEFLGLTTPLNSAGGIQFSEGNPLSGASTVTGGIFTPTTLGGLFKTANLQRTSWLVALNTLVQTGKAKVLSRPRIMCQSGKEAELFVGGEKPILTQQVVSLGGQGTTVEYKEYGLKLNIKPVISPEKRVQLKLVAEIKEIEGTTPDFLGGTQVSGATTVTTKTASAWPFITRNISTEVVLDNQQTLAVGGLMRRQETKEINKVKGMGDIPILGALFRSTTNKTGGGAGQRGDMELFITLTPTIVGAKKPLPPPELSVKKDAPTPIANVPGNLQTYSTIIQKRIFDNLNYPVAARQAGFHGTVTLSLNLSHTGALNDIKVKQSSGYHILDDNALTVAKSVTPYPPFPSIVDAQELWIDVPVVYSLE